MTNHPNRSSKTVAIRAAQKYVSAPIGRKTSWSLYGPAYMDKLSGPSTELRADSYTKSVNQRSTWVAEIALAIMGKPELIDTVDYIAYSDGPMPVADLVKRAIAKGPMSA